MRQSGGETSWLAKADTAAEGPRVLGEKEVGRQSKRRVDSQKRSERRQQMTNEIEKVYCGN
jgi:hypothetical protein